MHKNKLLRKKANIMKKAYALISVILMIILLFAWISLSLNSTSYTQNFIKNTYFYLKINNFLSNANEFCKYFLQKAKDDGKECLSDISFTYEKIFVKINYFYPLMECENFKFKYKNDESLSLVVIAHISAILNKNENVNDDILLTKSLILKPKDNFY